jgi:prevent-host-death family protein
MKHVGSYEAKTHLPRLLDSVATGESFVITRNGRPAARLVPVSTSASDVRGVIDELQAFGKRHRGRLRGISFRDLIEDGRRF